MEGREKYVNWKRKRGMKMNRGLACHFLIEPLKFVWGLPKWKFYLEKEQFMPGKVRKSDFVYLGIPLIYCSSKLGFAWHQAECYK